MNPRVTFWLWTAVLGIFLLGSAGAGYLLYRRHQGRKWMQENQRWEARAELPLQQAVSDEELQSLLVKENERLDRYEVLRPVIDELDLVTFWKVSGPEEALSQLKDSSEFRAGEGGGSVVFVATDRDQDMAGRLREAVLKSYQAMVMREAMLPPMPPES